MLSSIFEEFVSLWEHMHPEDGAPTGRMSMAEMQKRALAQSSRDDRAESFAGTLYGATLAGAGVVLREPSPDIARFNFDHLDSLRQRTVYLGDTFAYVMLEHNIKRFFTESTATGKKICAG